jgi:coenzyme F420-reducing hydrogenase gamma subunit
MDANPQRSSSVEEGGRMTGAVAEAAKPRLGVFKFASCDGCQLVLLDCEDELLAMADAVDIAHFPEASSHLAEEGPFDVTLVEGSISAPEHLDQIRSIRNVSKVLVTIGACATSGGLQALRNFGHLREYAERVYAHPEYLATLETSTPVSDHVEVDYELRGCPINKRQLLELLTAVLKGRRPEIRNESLCLGCKRYGYVCVMVAHGIPCLGPVTVNGCGAVCPSMGRGCYGCFGPKEGANTRALAERMLEMGIPRNEVMRSFRFITGYAEAFREESLRHEP